MPDALISSRDVERTKSELASEKGGRAYPARGAEFSSYS